MIVGATGWRKGTDQDDGGCHTKQLCTHDYHQEILDDIRMGEVKDDGLEEISYSDKAGLLGGKKA